MYSRAAGSLLDDSLITADLSEIIRSKSTSRGRSGGVSVGGLSDLGVR